MKNFGIWNDKKINIHNKSKNKFYHERDIWWCSLGVNVGFEQDGKDLDFQRPVLVLKGLGPNICLVVPITTSQKYHPLRIGIGGVTGKISKAIISQIRVVDTKRFINKIAVLDMESFEIIRKTIRGFL